MDIKQKLFLIKEISERLSSEGYPIIDTTLEHFKLPTYERWDGTVANYIINSLRSAPDNALLSIAKSFNIETEEYILFDPSFWRPNHFKLFLSHNSSIKSKITIVRDELFNYGITSFVAHDDIEPTKEWQTEIELALKTMNALVAFITTDFHTSNWTDQEIGYALGTNKLVIPIKIEHDPYGFISKNQALQGKGKEPRVISREIFNILLKHEKTNETMNDCLVNKFENSSSFSEAHANYELLSKISIIENHLLKRISKALINNYQISKAYGLPDKIASLLKKHGYKKNK